MADALTNNFSFTLQLTGSNSGTWGTDCNNNVISPLDVILGGTQAITMTSADITLTQTQWNNKAFKITGVLTGNHQLILPLSVNSVGNATGVGGEFVVDNETTGNFTVIVVTAATGSTGVTVSQGRRTVLYSDTVNVWYADDARALKARYSATPSASLAGQVGSVNTDVDLAWDGTSLYACTTAGAAGSAVYTKITGGVDPPQGYLTPVSGTPVITSDSIGAGTIYYTPLIGSIVPIWTGSVFSLVSFSETALALAAGSQAADGIYDVFAFLNSGAFQVAFGPSWISGAVAGNITAGSCARGTGAGSTQLQRQNGVWTNQNTITAANNGATTYNIPANQGTYLGTIYVDHTAGQVTCHRTIGQNRKWGIWNAYNRDPVTISAGDPSTSWLYAVTTVRASNNTPPSWTGPEFNVGSGTACNGLTVLCGLAEELVTVDFLQSMSVNGSGVSSGQFGVGVNSTTVFSGTAGRTGVNSCDSTGRGLLIQPPFLGIDTFCCLETINVGQGYLYGNGTAGAPMRMVATFRG